MGGNCDVYIFFLLCQCLQFDKDELKGASNLYIFHVATSCSLYEENLCQTLIGSILRE